MSQFQRAQAAYDSQEDPNCQQASFVCFECEQGCTAQVIGGDWESDCCDAPAERA